MLTPGTRLGAYEIIDALGAGGMGEVYRARDTRLDRTVAIKVLRGHTAADAESRERFEQEARAIAALNDPHICTIHDVGRHGDLDYLVLEYLEGETLADRLRRSPPLTIDEALTIAIQVGDALDRAHRAGIVHRDLKPGNVMLVQRGGTSSSPDIKLLDFGLAARTTTPRPQALDASLMATVGPSVVATRPPSATATAGISGTVQYMPPEQLDGAEGDHRADIFAFGCVLYEMLAGRKPFEGGSAVTVIAAIMSSDPPPIPALQSAHPLLDHVLRRCLEKDRERRWQSIRDVTGDLRWIVEHPLAAAVPVAAPASRGRGATIAIAVAVLAAALAGGAAVALRGRPAAPDAPLIRFEITTPPTDDPSASLSPDGSQVAFVANKDRIPMLWVRGLDAIENRVLAGTQGASYPFWSPDGRTVGFFADNKLKRIDVAGGTPLVITDAPTARGGAWSSEGVILFAPGVNAPIMRVPARGGQAERVTQPGPAVGPSHRWPQFLDARRFLFSSSLGTPDTNGLYLASLDGTPPVRVLPDEGTGRFVPPDTLLSIKRGALQVYNFNAESGTVQGEPRILTQGFDDAAGGGVFGTSQTGVLAYRTRTTQRRQLAWVDRRGNLLSAIGEPRDNDIGSPELSPDERSVAVFLHPGPGADNDVWVIELARNLGRPITTGPPADAHPFWDPDGEHVVFNSQRAGVRGPTRFPVGGGKAEPLFDKPQTGQALSWTRDRRFMLLRRDTEKTGVDLFALSTPGGDEIAVTQVPGDETEGQFSPDGKWVAFVGNQSGRPEVFVQSFPQGQGRTQVSTAGGAQVRWSADGKEIFYIAPDGTLMAVPVSLAGTTPDIKLPVALFQTHLATGINVIGNKAQYAVSRDGRFLLNTAVDSPSVPIVVWMNWTKTLGR